MNAFLLMAAALIPGQDPTTKVTKQPVVLVSPKATTPKWNTHCPNCTDAKASAAIYAYPIGLCPDCQAQLAATKTRPTTLPGCVCGGCDCSGGCECVRGFTANTPCPYDVGAKLAGTSCNHAIVDPIAASVQQFDDMIAQLNRGKAAYDLEIARLTKARNALVASQAPEPKPTVPTKNGGIAKATPNGNKPTLDAGTLRQKLNDLKDRTAQSERQFNELKERTAQSGRNLNELKEGTAQMERLLAELENLQNRGEDQK